MIAPLGTGAFLFCGFFALIISIKPISDAVHAGALRLGKLIFWLIVVIALTLVSVSLAPTALPVLGLTL